MRLFIHFANLIQSELFHLFCSIFPIKLVLREYSFTFYIFQKCSMVQHFILLTWIKFNPSMNHMPSKVLDEITLCIPTFHRYTVEV